MKLRYKIVFQEVGDTNIAVTVGDGAEECPQWMQLNETMRDIAEMLTEDVTREDIIQRMFDSYDIDRESLEGYVDEAIDFFQSKGLLDTVD